MIPVEELRAGDLVRLPARGEREVVRVEVYPPIPALVERGLETYASDAYVVVYRPGSDGPEGQLRVLRRGDLVDARRPGRYDRGAKREAGGTGSVRLADTTPPASSSSPSPPRARATDPRTSHAAARSVGALRDSQQAVLRLFRELGPMSDDLLVERYIAAAAEGLRPQSPSGIRTRRHELAEAGELVVVGESRTAAGRACNVWGLAQEALSVYDPEPSL